MQADPVYPALADLLNEYPAQAGCIYSTYADLSLSQQWKDLRVLGLAELGWAVLFGRKSFEDPIRMVLPLHLQASNLTPKVLKALYDQLDRLTIELLPSTLPAPIEDRTRTIPDDQLASTLDIKTIYISMVTPDSSVVYYKLTKGIKKPDDVPDE